MPRKTFVAGEVLAAADVNEFLADQAVMTFAGTAARGSAIASPVEGMVTYLEDDDQLEVYGGTAVGWSSASNFIFGTAVPTDGQVASYSTAVSGWIPADASGGAILQVESVAKTTTFTTTSTSYVDWTDMTITITPQSASSKFYVQIFAPEISSALNEQVFVQVVRDGSAVFGPGTNQHYANSTYGNISIAYLDAPATASAVTYKAQVRIGGGNSTSFNRGVITVMEIAG